MFAYVPQQWATPRSLVVVLHGCSQTAAGYDLGTGWSTLADRYGFALLFPQQRRSNNPNRCFNWFSPAQTTRDHGEALSIREGVGAMVTRHAIAPDRIFVTGLSAGGAMACVMLATYPDVFSGGGIVAGLPFGAASNVQDAVVAMAGGRRRTPREWGDLVRAASPHRGPWPKVSVWHGTADATVSSANADEVVKQWADVHGLDLDASRTDWVDGYPRRSWSGQSASPVLESFTITGMAHGTPLSTRAGEDAHGQAGPFLLEAGIASSFHMATFWGLTGTRVGGEWPPRPRSEQEPRVSAAESSTSAWPEHRARPPLDVVGAIAKLFGSSGSSRP
jgi:feruloyl esterase